MQRLSNLLTQLNSRRDSLFLLAATIAAYGFDYLFNVITGRLLGPVGFNIIIALGALGQIFVLGSRVIQTVTTRYVARFHAGNNRTGLANFFYAALRRALSGGALITLVLLLLTRPIAAFMNIDELAALAALMLAVWMMTFRPISDGTLQGEQRFVALGVVLVAQSVARIVVGVGLVVLGWGVFGAMVALPIAILLAFLVGLYALRDLRDYRTQDHHAIEFGEFFRYSSYTAAGLLGFALLVNMDALLVNRFFSAEIAGLYGSAITLGKIVQFFPVAIVMVLFPKASHRQATNRDPAGVLPPAFGFTTLVCVSLSLVYFLFPNNLIGLLFGTQYQLEGPTLGLIGLSMWLLSMMNVWLNYFLSLDQTQYVLIIWVGVLLQAISFFIWHDYLWQLPVAMALNGLWLTLAGWLVFVRQRNPKTS